MCETRKPDTLGPMQHRFNITTCEGKDPQGHQLRSPITAFLAETDLGPSPQLDIPLTITGKLVHVTPVGLTPEQLFQFQFKQDVEVGFEGRGYRFSKLGQDGTFELSIIYQP